MAGTEHNIITIPPELPLIALKNTVLFPKTVIPLIVQRPKSVNALQAAMDKHRLVLFVTQKNIEDDVDIKDLFTVGTIGRIISVFRLPDGSSKIDVEGITRACVVSFLDQAPYFKVHTELFSAERTANTLEEEALMRRVLEQFKEIAETRSFPTILPEVVYMMTRLKDAEQIIGLVTANLNLEVQDQQKILEIRSAAQALQQLNVFLTRELHIVEAERDLARETKKKIGKMQKELFLREQLKSIEKELGVEDEGAEWDALKKKIRAAGMPRDAHEKAMKEFNRLVKMPAFNPEVSYLRTYLDWLVELPWSSKSKEKIDLKEAEKTLNAEHYGMPKVKERILEYLAVQKQVGKLKGPILCFVGPPGTGKTSVGQSIAKALGRKFVRVSLGGLRDEAEIRGHRRTYVGALPGRVIQGVHSAKTKNPVFMLDEIDKVGMDFRGDPSSALLEALDPAQNHAFSDHYLEIPFDLSEVLFVTTANVLDTIPPALRDRLEIIGFPGYTDEEKLRIAKDFLIPKLFIEHGMKKKALAMSDAVILDIIRNHTREAGVRELQRQLAAIIRKVTRKLVESPSAKQVVITQRDLHNYLGPIKYTHDMAEAKDEVGYVNGLSWTQVGGEILPVEVTKMPGKGKLIITGQLGDVMKESATAALSYARAKVAKYGIKDDFSRQDIHIHLPSGAIRKDGPSAGAALTTALISLFLNKPVRRDVGMTGEMTLRGKLLEIGGVKEKMLAAYRAGLKTIVMPVENKKDLVDVPKEVKNKLKFIYAKTIDDVLKAALR